MIQTLSGSTRQRIAIIGSGISGLVCADALHAQHEITVFEAGDHVGGHTNTIDVDHDGERHAIDTGFIVYNERNYPAFTALLQRLGVATRPTTMSFSVKCARTGIEYNGTSINTLFAQRRNALRPRFLGMIRDIMRFNRDALDVLAWSDAAMSVADFVADRRYGDAFVTHYLVPMGAAIWSCPPNRFRQFPIRFVAEFMQNHAMLQVNGRPQWRVIDGGSREYVRALTAPFRDRIQLRTPVLRVRRAPDHVEVSTGRERAERFDHAIFACHSDQALAVLEDPTPVETEVLSAFPYQTNDAVLHTDVSLLPRRRRAWAAWNYHLPPSPSSQDAPATVTYNMNILQSLSARQTYCVTLNETEQIAPDKILRRMTYEHPVFTQRRDEAQQRHPELIDANRTSYCGAYWGYGFHEDGVQSALRVCDVLAGVPA